MRCVVRGVVALRDAPVDGSDRRLLTGSVEQLHDDLGVYAGLGVDEVFLDLNFDSDHVGNPDADPRPGSNWPPGSCRSGARPGSPCPMILQLWSL